MPTNRLLVTTGEPAGIGPEITLRLLAQSPELAAQICLVGDLDYLKTLVVHFGLRLDLYTFDANEALMQSQSELVLRCPVIHVALRSEVVWGQPNVANAPYVLGTLDAALHAIELGWCSGMVTCPVHKGVINQAGIAFSGHTEYLAQACCVDEVVMLLADPKPDGLKVALATTHLPISQVPQSITQNSLTRTIDILHHDFKKYFTGSIPNIWVTGLNPHAGEGGHLGQEEILTIEPAIAAAQGRGVWVSGPYSADTVFNHRDVSQADVILAMFHDQALPVLKYASFGHAVNITLGLPIVRTSVDHGTAFDLAGKGVADLGSLRAAIGMAASMVLASQSKLDLS